MPENFIIVDEGTKDVLRRIRSPKIVITHPLDGPVCVNFSNRELVFIDGKQVAERSIPNMSKTLTMDVMLEDIEYVNPLTGLPETIKVAQVTTAIIAAYVKWYKEMIAQLNMTDEELEGEELPIE